MLPRTSTAAAKRTHDSSSDSSNTNEMMIAGVTNEQKMDNLTDKQTEAYRLRHTQTIILLHLFHSIHSRFQPWWYAAAATAAGRRPNDQPMGNKRRCCCSHDDNKREKGKERKEKGEEEREKNNIRLDWTIQTPSNSNNNNNNTKSVLFCGGVGWGGSKRLLHRQRQADRQPKKKGDEWIQFLLTLCCFLLSLSRRSYRILLSSYRTGKAFDFYFYFYFFMLLALIIAQCCSDRGAGDDDGSRLHLVRHSPPFCYSQTCCSLLTVSLIRVVPFHSCYYWLQ